SGKLALRLESIDLRSVVEQSIETFREAAGARRFKRTLPAGPVPVVGDRVRLTQVVNNLLDNAFKYTERNGSIRVALTLAPEEAVLAVVDDGRGIRAEALPHIFAPFYQEAAERGGPRGFGLGLAMVEQIVRLHPGRVRALSNGEGYGTTLEVRLPLALARKPQNLG